MLPLWESPLGPIRSGRYIWPAVAKRLPPRTRPYAEFRPGQPIAQSCYVRFLWRN